MQQGAKILDQSVWDEYSGRIRKRIPGPLFDTFIKPLRPTTDGTGDLVLEVPDQKLLEHIRSRYLEVMSEILSDTACRGQIRLRSFHEVPSNQSIAAAQAVVKKEESYFACSRLARPIETLSKLDFPSSVAFLYGGPGSGKSALLQHLEGIWSMSNIDFRIMSLETFLTEFSLSLTRKDTIRWRNDLRKNRVIAIDDFQFIKGTAKKSQEELRNLIEEFREKGHKLILSSELPADALPLVPDFASRILESYVVPLDGPSYETRVKILRIKAEQSGLQISEESLAYLAKNIVGDARRLNSAVLRMAASDLCSPERHQIDAVCNDLYTGVRHVSPERILRITAELLGVTVEAITGPARDKQIALARHIVGFICSQHLRLPLAKTAEILGRKDHASVIHARDRIQAMIESDLFTARLVDDILHRLVHQN